MRAKRAPQAHDMFEPNRQYCPDMGGASRAKLLRQGHGLWYSMKFWVNWITWPCHAASTKVRKNAPPNRFLGPTNLESCNM